MSYLVFPRVRVQAANMLSCSFLVGGPPIFAAYGLGEALCHHLGGKGRVSGLAFIHHHRQALGQSNKYGQFMPQQRRGAAFTFDWGSKDWKGSDYSSKNKYALSLQPVACAHWLVSLIWDLENVRDEAGACRFLHQARLAGGLITQHGKIVFTETMTEALDCVRNGYIVLDRRDLLEYPGCNQAESLVQALGAVFSAKSGNTWLSATCVGYAAITDFAHRARAREGYLHAFAEPLVGMVQYRSLRQWQKEKQGLEEDALWRPRWLQDDVFVLQQDLAQLEPI